MESGTYDVIKSRLKNQGDALSGKAEALNQLRKEVFGSLETKLLSSERILTDNNCIPRDMAPVDDWFIFGYNVHIGLKQVVEVADVFSIYRYGEEGFVKESLDVIGDETFKKDFEDLYRYYKYTSFAKFTILDPYLYMVFQTGKEATDIKVFKWLIKGNSLTYVDNRSEHEVKFNLGNDFKFTRATRDQQRSGLHPHVSILDKVFVETIGGDLTIKVEDNTDTGKGIYAEPVEDKDQNLDDAEIYYMDLDQLILLKILPYKEKQFRYFVFNNKLKTIVRIDSMEFTCKLLPGGHGLIFPQGYYLLSGEYKLFDVPLDYAVFDQSIRSINGEDFQFIFYNMVSGTYLIYSYNLIEQTIDMPIVCSGYSHFNNGEMIVFRHEEEPRKNHALQVWQTPYVAKDHQVGTKIDSVLYKIGNKEVVNCIAACRGIAKLIQKGDTYQSVYLDIVKEAQSILDSYFWLDKEETFHLALELRALKESATFAIGEFEKVTRLKKSTAKQIEAVTEETDELLRKTDYASFDSINAYVDALSAFRALRGKIASLRELMYTDHDHVADLEARVKETNDSFSSACVSYIVSPEGLKPYEEKVAILQEEIAKVSKSQEGLSLSQEMDQTSEDLELLMAIVSNFKIDDPTVATAVIEKISDLFSLMNNAKARLKARIETFTKTEMTVQFNAQIRLLSQAVVNYLEISDTEEKCETYINKLLVQLQELEGKFAEFEEFVLLLNDKREEIYSAFETRKQALLDKLNKRLVALFDSSKRILTGMGNRLLAFETQEEISGYLATDIMAEKVREIVVELRSLGDSVKADEISGQLKALKENALRQLKDKRDLFLGGKDVIKFGKHHFSVNRKAIDLSIVLKDKGLFYHITGTDFWEPVVYENLETYSEVFEQQLVSENAQVYRGEYLAYSIFEAARRDGIGALKDLQALTATQRVDVVRRFMETRYQEGYTKGVHDEDGSKLLECLVNLYHSVDLLTYTSEARSMARLYWGRLVDPGVKALLKSRLEHLAKVSTFFEGAPALVSYLPTVRQHLEEAYAEFDFFKAELIPRAAEYLCHELMLGGVFVTSLEARQLQEGFLRYLREKDALFTFEQSLKHSQKDVEGQFYLAKAWVSAYIDHELKGDDALAAFSDEVVVILLEEGDQSRVIPVATKVRLEGLVGSHGVIDQGAYVLDYTAFMKRLAWFSEHEVPAYEGFQKIKSELVHSFKAKLRLDDFKPNVLSAFVRNQLIDQVYLPLVGDNLAKQMGTVGDDKRTDLMGLLLLVSPPGYGKTTLMEYIAHRLGIILVKVNGPSLGNEVTSLDPEKAGHSSAREELRKLNLALKMGNNVMLYLDDIQHCHPEFLQKFISLCDGQRKIEGVYDGVGQTFDLRGKKIAVVMAGNPYTESGEKFKIPDMLANRADVYNLGDMLRENESAFKRSYIENALTSNPVLSKLSHRSPQDLYSLMAMASGADPETVTLEGTYTGDELGEYLKVIQKLYTVQEIVLKVNMAYISSAAQADEYRNEPAFKLQGSYRNMNKIAERVVSVMNDEELFRQVLMSYENDCQTLTTGAESNMLKWKEIVGCLSEAERQRYEEIKVLYNKQKLAKGDDKMGQAVVVLSDLSDQLGKIRDVLAR